MPVDRTVTMTIRALLVLLLMLPLALAGAAGAAASPLATTAFLRLAHLSPDTPTVDVSVVAVADPTVRLDVPGVAYGAVSDYEVLAPGTYTVSMLTAGAPTGSPPIITTTFSADPGEAVTVAGLGNNAGLALRVLRDDLSTPPAGFAKVRIINASPATPTLDIRLAAGPVVAEGVPYADATTYRTMPVGDWELVVGGPGAFGTSLPVTLDENAVYSVLVVMKDGSLAAEIRVDGTGTPTTPSGSIAAGYGGAAPGDPAPAEIGLLVGSLIALAIITGRTSRVVNRAARRPEHRG